MSFFLRVFCSLLILLPTGNSVAHPFGQQPTGTTTQHFILEDGTPVRLRISQTVSSADAHVNDRVEFEVLEEVRVNGVLVVPKGGVAWGTVTEAQPKRRMARGGKLEIVMDSVRLADGEKAALRAVKEGKGGGHVGGMTIGIVAAAVVFWPVAPLFLLMHGRDITFPKGTDVPTFINGDMKLDQAKFQQLDEGSTQSASSPAVSNLTVSSNPPGAEIYLDQNFVGNTPSTVNGPAGKHIVLVKKTGYQEWAKEMNLSGGTITLIADLTPGSTITTASAPDTSHQVLTPPHSAIGPDTC